MKATIQQLEQGTQHCQTNKHNLVSSGDIRLSCLFVRCLSIPEKLPRAAMEEYQQWKRPLAILPSWYNIPWCIKTDTGYCSNVLNFNFYLRKLFWKTGTLKLPNFSRWRTFSPSDDRKNKERNPPTQLGECSNSQPSDEMKDILSTQHHIGGEKTGRLHIRKAEDLDRGPLFMRQSGATTVALAQPN